jgi:signal peptidase I
MSLRRVRSIAGLLLVVAVVGAWAVWLRPQFLGGPTAIVVVAGTSMEPGLHTRDLVLVQRKPTYRHGDVVAYRVPRSGAGAGGVVIHRIVGGSAASGYVLQGDNRNTRDQWRPTPADILGKQWVTFPTSHRSLSVFTSPLVFAGLAGLFAFGLVALPSSRKR